MGVDSSDAGPTQGRLLRTLRTPRAHLVSPSDCTEGACASRCFAPLPFVRFFLALLLAPSLLSVVVVLSCVSGLSGLASSEWTEDRVDGVYESSGQRHCVGGAGTPGCLRCSMPRACRARCADFLSR